MKLAKIAGLATAGLALTTALPAAATQQQAMDCSYQSVPLASVRQAESLVLNGGAPRASSEVNALLAATRKCLADNGVDTERAADYSNYAHSRWIRAYAIEELRKTGMPLDIVDTVVNIGPGRANTPNQDWGATESNELIRRFRAAGFDHSGVPDGTWRKLGVYMGATAVVFGFQP